MKKFIVLYWIGSSEYTKFMAILAEDVNDAEVKFREYTDSLAGHGRWRYTIYPDSPRKEGVCDITLGRRKG